MHGGDTARSADSLMVFIHGGGVASWMWDEQIASFGARHATYAPDLPGHGARFSEQFVSIRDTAEELAEALQARPEHDRTVIGFSLGGQIALELAAHYPDLVTRLVVVSALANGYPLAPAAETLVRAAAPLARMPWFAQRQAASLGIPPMKLDAYLRDSKRLATPTLAAVTRANASFRLPASWDDYEGASLFLAGRNEPRMVRRGLASLAERSSRGEYRLHATAGHEIPFQHGDWLAEQVAGHVHRD